MSTSIDAIAARFETLHTRKIDLSLGRMMRLLGDLGNPQNRLPPVIHVAGTNGKGSTTAFLRAALEAAGNRVHVYTSPHLVSFNERFRLAGVMADDAQLGDAIDRVERANAGQAITVFEITTAAAFLLFSEIAAEYTVLEVGLGGRFDATNVVERPAATIITPVSLDHQEFLGSTVAQIALEKAGILKRNVPAVIGDQTEEGMKVIEREALRIGALRIVADRDYFVRAENKRLVFEDNFGLIDLPLPRLPGRHQYGNAAMALAALRAINPEFPVRALEQGLKEVQWPARMQRLRPGPLVALGPQPAEYWLDGAHNDAGGQVLAEAMADMEESAPAPLVLICASPARKDTRALLGHFKGLAQEVLAVPMVGEHIGRTPEEVATIAREVGLNATAYGSVAEALKTLAARSWLKAPRILIAGTLYLAGSVLAENDEAPK